MTISKKVKKALEIFYSKSLKNNQLDHIKPKAKGGDDSIENLQIISGRLNMAKSDRYEEPRKWQQKFWDSWAASMKREFLLTAIPGAGKTRAATKVSHDFLLAGNDRRLLIVVPTVNLQEQWRLEASYRGIALQTSEFGTEFRGEFVGAVATYQSLDTQAMTFKVICSRSPTLVILDEPHHCAEKKSWGNNAKEAFNLAKRILLLSGTPFRTDGKAIPFIEYDGQGFSVADERYDYPDALRDGVVRLLNFDYNRGRYDWLQDGIVDNYEFHSDLSEKEASERLYRLLTAQGDWVKEQITKAHAQLQQIRKYIPDAAAMAACIDRNHAEQIAHVIKTVTGREPSIIVSDNEIATDTVAKFRSAKTEWLVAVKQVTEGTDIKRLQVLCWLTNTATELFFRQLIGRVSRVRFKEDEVSEEVFNQDNTGYVFLPDDPRLIMFARRLEQIQVQALVGEAEKEKRERDQGEVRPDGVFVSSTHDGTAHVLIGLKEYSLVEAEQIKQIGLDFSVSLDKAAKFFEALQEGKYKPALADFRPIAKEEKTYEEKIIDMRRACNRKAYRLSQVIGCTVNDVHLRFKKQSTMDLVELQDKLQILLQCIIDRRMP